MLELKNIYKTYRNKNGVTHRALTDINLTLKDKGLVFIVGKSGGGKTTLLNVIGALDGIDRGELIFKGQSFKGFKKVEYDAYRNTHIGVVFQEFNMINTLTVKQNVEFSLSLQGKSDDKIVNEVLTKLGIEDLKDRLPNTLSGGQTQRVAIARAIVKNPEIILADEPTGSLDSATGDEIMELLKELSKDRLVVVVTHDRDKADEIGDRVIEIKDGKIHKDLIKVDYTVENRVDIVGNTLIRVPKGESLKENNIEDINYLLKNNLRDSYIVAENDTLKVKSLNQHIKNAVVINDEKETTNFIPYRKENLSYNDKSPLLPSKIPFSKSLTLSYGNLKYKKGILALTVIMLVLSLFIMGFAVALTNFDYDRAIAKTITRDSTSAMLLNKNEQYERDNAFNSYEIADLRELSNVYSYYQSVFYVDGYNYKNTSLFNNFYGVVEVDDVTKLGYTMLAGKSKIEGDKNIVVTDFIISELMECNYFTNVSDIEQAVGKKIELLGEMYTITGIIKTDFSRYDSIKELRELYGDMYYYYDYNKGMINEQLEVDLASRLAIIYGQVGIYQSIKELTAEKNLYLIGSTASEISIPSTRILKNADNTAATFYYNENEGIVISISVFNAMFNTDIADLGTESRDIISDKLDGFNSLNNRNYYISYIASGKSYYGGASYNSNVAGVINSLTIVGVSLGEGNYVVVEEQILDNLINELNNSGVVIKLKDNNKENLNLLRYIKDKGYTINAYFTPVYRNHSFIKQSLSEVLKRVTSVIVIAVTILLYIFIKSGVNYNRKQIGIIRAMGARVMDIIMIYTIEGFLITLFSLGLASVLTAIAVPIINALSSNAYNFNNTFIVFSPLAIVLMLLLSIIITALSLIMTLRKFLKMTPTNTMNG